MERQNDESLPADFQDLTGSEVDDLAKRATERLRTRRKANDDLPARFVENMADLADSYQEGEEAFDETATRIFEENRARAPEQKS